MFRITAYSLVSALLLMGCGKEAKEKDTEPTPAPTATAQADDHLHGDTAAGIPGTAGMGMMGQQMMGQMDSTMRAMMGASGDSMKAMLPMHREMAENMMEQMNSDVHAHAKADPAWDALADSVRTDLMHMGDLADSELQRRMGAHVARMRRLMEMHQKMMGGM